MPRYTSSIVSAIALSVTLAVSILMPSAAHAQTIHACVSNAGAIRIAALCTRTESPLSWNVQGPAGPVGPVGPRGPQGPIGPQGPTGTVGTTASLQKLNIVNGSNRVLATLGPTSDGNVFTFFDSAGKKTLTIGNNANETATGAIAWDNNNVVPGPGVPRVGWGESNPSAPLSSGFGDRVYDKSGHTRTGFGMSYDLMTNAIYAINGDGSSEGVGTFTTGFRGYFANDATSPASRQYGGLGTNGDSIWGEVDTNGILRVSAVQQVADELDPAGRKGNGFAIWDSNGLQEASMAAFIDGSLAGFNVVDPNNIDRFSSYLIFQNGGSSLAIDTRDANGNLTGHLP